jgi:hypothetical protein
VALTINAKIYIRSCRVSHSLSKHQFQFIYFAVITEEPEFIETIENVTVPAGELSVNVHHTFRRF